MNAPSGTLLLLLSTLLFVGGCVDNNSVTQEEINTMNRVDSIVSGLLFEKDLDKNTSYNVRKNGFVVIKFDKSVSSETYNDIVGQLRSNSNIYGVRAEQSGREVCPMRPGR